MRLLPDFGTGGVVVNLPGARVIVLVGIEEKSGFCKASSLARLMAPSLPSGDR